MSRQRVSQYGVMRRAGIRRVTSWLAATVLVSLMGAYPAMAQLPEGLSPEVAERFMSMSTRQQMAIARQYGLSLTQLKEQANEVLAPEVSNVPGAPGLPQMGLGDRGVPLLPYESPGETLMLEEDGLLDEEVDVETDELQRFGTSFFNGEISTFAQTDDAPVPSDYRIGVGDELRIYIYGGQERDVVTRVSREGEMLVPPLEPLPVVGLTLEAARDLVSEKIAEQIIGARAVVTLARLRAISITLAGEVAAPGTYTVSGLTTLSQAVFQAGGVSDIGSLRDIRVLRQGGIVTSFDLYDLLLKGDASNDIRLRSGDVVFTPVAGGEVTLDGEVRRPAIYEIKAGDTMRNALDMAGGLTPMAYPSSVSFKRFSSAEDQGIGTTLDLSLASDLNTVLAAGDEIVVGSKGVQLANAVSVEGAVNRPGAFGWRAELRVSDLFSNSSSDFAENADLRYSLIVRQPVPESPTSILYVDLAEALENPGSMADIGLKARDRLLVFSKADPDALELLGEEALVDETSRAMMLAPVVAQLEADAVSGRTLPNIVSVSGAVRAPGIYPLAQNADISYLLRAAGGAVSTAYVDAAEVRSVNLSRGEELVSYRRVNLGTREGQTVSLGARDHLTVRQIPSAIDQDYVELRGEFRFPGRYRIGRGETLSDVIERAGGLTAEAYPRGSVFTRASVALNEQRRAEAFVADLQKTFASSLVTAESNNISVVELEQISTLLEQVPAAGRIVVDLEAALAGDSVADLELEANDTIAVPRAPKTVTVIGEVRQPGTHLMVSELTLDDYISLSAGLTPRADADALYVIKANGEVIMPKSRNWWRFENNQARLEAGDTVVAPLDYEYQEPISLWRDITQVIYQGVVAVAAVANL
jgi:polysaccharide export outer membrane protein